MNSITVAKINKIIDENKTVNNIQGRLSNLEDKVDDLDVKFTGMQSQMHKFGLNQESMIATLDGLIERITPALKKNEQYDGVKESIEQHELRLRTVEYTIKKHLKEDH